MPINNSKANSDNAWTNNAISCLHDDIKPITHTYEILENTHKHRHRWTTSGMKSTPMHKPRAPCCEESGEYRQALTYTHNIRDEQHTCATPQKEIKSTPSPYLEKRWKNTVATPQKMWKAYLPITWRRDERILSQHLRRNEKHTFSAPGWKMKAYLPNTSEEM